MQVKTGVRTGQRGVEKRGGSAVVLLFDGFEGVLI